MAKKPTPERIADCRRRRSRLREALVRIILRRADEHQGKARKDAA